MEKIDLNGNYGRVLGGLGTYLTSITPLSIQVLVNVTSPATVWCRALESEQRLDEEKVMAEGGQQVECTFSRLCTNSNR